MSTVAMKSGDTKTMTKRRGITLTLPLKEAGIWEIAQKAINSNCKEFRASSGGLYLKAKRIAKAFRREVTGKPCEGKSHARFDEGVVGT